MVNMYLYRNSLPTIQIVSHGYYLKYFNENFNMTFGYPRADTCGTCDALRVQIESATDAQKMTLQAQKEDHLRRAENFYASLRTNTKLAKMNAHITTVSFDFQQNLPLPNIPAEVFYMHQLWLYVFGVIECGANCAVGPSSLLGKGAVK